MGSLQPGMPSPTMIPVTWDILIVNLKEIFFSIPLHTDDIPKFALTVPSHSTSQTLLMESAATGYEK